MTERSKKRPTPERKKLKLSDADRHRRFLAMAREVEASDSPEDFEKAFTRVTAPPKKQDRQK